MASSDRMDSLCKRNKCCDPYKLHEKPVTKGLRKVSEKTRTIHRFLHFESDDQLCTSCRKRVAALAEDILTVESSQSEQSAAEEEVEEAYSRQVLPGTSATAGHVFISPEHEISVLNASLSILGESPVIKRKLYTRTLYVKEKARKIESTVRRKIELGTGGSISDFAPAQPDNILSLSD
jgi:hypothetical protein